REIHVNMNNKYYILFGHEVIDVPLLKWTEWMEESFRTKPDRRIVKQQTLPNGKFVSTVFLGINHNFSFKGPPLLFETMVFSKDKKKFNFVSYKEDEFPETLDIERYSTWEEALI